MLGGLNKFLAPGKRAYLRGELNREITVCLLLRHFTLNFSCFYFLMWHAEDGT